jgi:asparagine synthase (glutamine-hydrolysing)
VSGILALARTDGAPLDVLLLERLTAALAFRGPDRIATETLGAVGLGHALLATTFEAERERQPATLDGKVWITADARIDGRADLMAELRRLQGAELDRATDAELVLRAYHAWGESCVARLLGDFAFVVWDAPRRMLFAARDHFGVKPLYYALRGGGLVLGNTLSSIRGHPCVSDRLDDSAVGSFLLWGENWDRSTTTFADIRCVPPAHTLRWTEKQTDVELRRYWDVPDEVPAPRYSDARGYAERFRDLLGEAVEDRLRTRSAAIFMSGGMDSPMVAAVARERMTAAGGDGRREAHTLVHDRLHDARERHFSALAARHIGIPIRHVVADDDGSWNWVLDAEAPEPALLGAVGPDVPGRREALAVGRVALTGWDGDSLLAANVGALWRERFRRGELGSLGRELGWHVRSRRVPRVGVRAALTAGRERRAGLAFVGYPSWLTPAFEATEDLRARWSARWAAPDPGRTARGRAHSYLSTPVWRSVLDPADPGLSGVTVEQRHPLMDLRLVDYTLSLPTVPWCVDKELFRMSMSAELPIPVLRRPKTPFAGAAPGTVLPEREPLSAAELAPELEEYVDVRRYRDAWERLRVASARPDPLTFAAFNTFALNGWLRSRSRRNGAA